LSAELVEKIRRIYFAFAQVRDGNVLQVQPQYQKLPVGFAWMIDFNQGKSDAELRDRALNVVANIASIKDHLKNYCASKNKIFGGDVLINTDLNVGVIHDLWNVDKHGQLTQSRSGKFPKVRDLRQSMRLKTGTEAGSGVMFQMDLNGNTRIDAGKGGSAETIIDGEVVDKNNNRIGGFQEICERAVEAWEKELSAAGIPIALIR
jgi:hypothetical protein